MRDRAPAETTLRELEVAITVHRGELAALERARDILERIAHEHLDQCDGYGPKSPCSGLVAARFCYRCGHTIRRCVQHGGARSAAHYLTQHFDEHGGSDVRDPSADDARRLPGGGPAVSVGELQAPPVDRGRER